VVYVLDDVHGCAIDWQCGLGRAALLEQHRLEGLLE